MIDKKEATAGCATYIEDTGPFQGASESGNVKDPRETQLVRKLDIRILPVMWAMYFLNYADRGAFASARLNNLEADLGLVGSQFNVCVAIFWPGYLITIIPSNLVISSKYVRPSVYLAVTMAAWAAVCACTAAVNGYGSLIGVRFLLGIFEAPFYPGALLLLCNFYTREELPLRIAILFSGALAANAFSGLIATATFSTLDQAHGLAGWHWLFIIEGAVTFGIALVSLLMLPDNPSTTRWLTPEERQLAQDRIAAETVNPENDYSMSVLDGFKQALRDPKVYLLCFIQHAHLGTSSFTGFFPTVVATLGFGPTISLALTCPPYVFAGLVCLLAARSSGKHQEFTWHITIPMIISATGFLISAATLNTGARYFSMFLFASGSYATNSMILAWVSSTLGQTPEKKSASLGIVNFVSMISFAYTPFLYPQSDGPRYLIAMATSAAFSVATIVSAWSLRLWLRYTNKRIQMASGSGVGGSVLFPY